MSTTTTTTMATDRSDWKQKLLSQLKQRNKRETHGFEDLVESHNKLFEASVSLKNKNVHQTVELERLKEENLGLQIRADSGGGGNERNPQLDLKLYQLHEELTDLHRKRGENAQHIIDLTSTMKEKERELQVKEGKLIDSTANENSLRMEMRHLESVIMELEATNQMLKDEHQALQLAFTTLEEKYRKAQEDNTELLARWMTLKKDDADRINNDNDVFQRKKEQKLQHELAEAAKEQKSILDPEKAGVYLKGATPFCLMACVPTRCLHKYDAHEGEVNAIKWSSTGSLFATGGSDRKVKLWEFQAGQCNCKGTLLGSNAGLTSIEFDPGDSMILGASNDYASRLWSLSDQRLRHTLTGHSGKVLAAKFLGDPTKVVSGSHDRTIKIWDLHSKACIKTIFAGSSCNDLVTLHGANIISGHFDKRVRFWDTRSDTTTNEILLTGRITSLDLSADGMSLLACTRDDSLKVINLRMNQVSQTLCADNFKVAFDWSRAMFSPHATYAMAGSSDGSLYIWNVANGKVERTLKEHSHAIIACSWHPAGSIVLTSEKQKRVCVWSDI